MNHCFRLTKGADLKEGIMEYAKKNNINAGAIICAVGCLSSFHVRLAGAKDYLTIEEDLEIVGITGTISFDDIHIHISASDSKGATYGGHLKNGCLVNTTAEICILEFKDYVFNRMFDDNTGYDEIVMKKIA